MGDGARQPWIPIQAMSFWESYLTSPSLSFYIYQLGSKYFRILTSSLNPVCSLRSINSPVTSTAAAITMRDSNKGRRERTRERMKSHAGIQDGQEGRGVEGGCGMTEV